MPIRDSSSIRILLPDVADAKFVPGEYINSEIRKNQLHQKDQLRLLTPLMKTEAEKQELEAKLMQIRKFEASKDQSDMQWLVEIHIIVF